MLNPLKELARDITAERRKHLATGADLHRALKNQLEALDRVSERASEESGVEGDDREGDVWAEVEREGGVGGEREGGEGGEGYVGQGMRE